MSERIQRLTRDILGHFGDEACAPDFILGFGKKHFLNYCHRKQQKLCLLIKRTRAVVYMYSLSRA